MHTAPLVAQLEGISETLGDMAITRLREGLEGTASGDAGADEKQLAKARRAVDKAAAVLAAMADNEFA